jgi:hypothetical protein
MKMCSNVEEEPRKKKNKTIRTIKTNTIITISSCEGLPDACFYTYGQLPDGLNYFFLCYGYEIINYKGISFLNIL